MFRKLRGKPSKDLMRNGLLGRGLITNIEGTNVATGVGPDPKHVCIFTLEVALDNVPRYSATCRQAVSQVLLPALASGESFVAVRVNPDDHSEVAIDFDEALPDVRASEKDKAGSAAQVLAEGLPCPGRDHPVRADGNEEPGRRRHARIPADRHRRGPQALPDEGRVAGATRGAAAGLPRQQGSGQADA